MKFIVVGVNHEQLNMDERKLFYFHESDKLAFTTWLLDLNINQCLILSTCNRSEVYVMADDLFDNSKLKDAYLAYFHQNSDKIMIKSDDEAILHLLQVACGLKSMVVGEDQILHQIKQALNFTLKYHLGGKELYYLFQQTISFAKKIKSQYHLNEHPLSISYLGFLMIKEYLNHDTTIMVCGIGEMSQLMLKYLKGHQIYLVNRSQKNVEAFLNENVCYVPFEQRYQYLDKVDIVISATASPHLVFEKKHLLNYDKKIYLDLALPRDIDVTIKEELQVRLIDIDELQKIANSHQKIRLSRCQEIESECQLVLKELKRHLQLMKSDSVIEKLQNYYLNVSQETYDLLVKKLSLSKHEDYLLKKVLDTSFLRLMKEPLNLIKNEEIEVEQYLLMLEKILVSKEN